MPAIQLSRLNAEIQFLTTRIEDQEHFVRSLIDLFERYAAWSFRQGDSSRRNIQIPQYHLPPIVMQKLALSLRPFCASNPVGVKNLAETLRTGSHLETRQLAITLLGMLIEGEPVLFMQTVERWLISEKENFLRVELLRKGCEKMRRDYPLVWLDRIEDWLASTEPIWKSSGLQALTASLNDATFSYLPNVFRLATDLMIQAPQALSTPLQELLDAMINRSAVETGFFLQQILLRNASAETARLVRKKLPRLPNQSQQALRTLLADRNSANSQRADDG